MTRRPGINALIFILLGPIAWALHFFLVYGPQAVICATTRAHEAGEGTLATSWIGLATLAIALPLGLSLSMPAWVAQMLRLRQDGPERIFTIRAFRLLAFLSLVGVVLAGSASLIIDPCGQLR